MTTKKAGAVGRGLRPIELIGAFQCGSHAGLTYDGDGGYIDIHVDLERDDYAAFEVTVLGCIVERGGVRSIDKVSRYDTRARAATEAAATLLALLKRAHSAHARIQKQKVDWL